MMTSSRPFFVSDPADWSPVAQQQAFRRILNAFSYPGRIVRLDSPAAHALPIVLATLLDPAATLADPCEVVSPQDRQRLGACSADASRAQFVVMPGSRLPDFEPSIGVLESPEQGATLLLLADKLTDCSGLRLKGPGIRNSATVHVDGVNDQWWTLRESWNGSFPLGVDVLLLCSDSLAAIPRTIQITVEGSR
jgi:alpha-D-ribose 1-methylphosphonate 5-triphosphate synthase subunit PhnH